VVVIKKIFYFRIISNNDDLCNEETILNSDNMQLAHPEPRQVLMSAPNLPKSDLEKYVIV